MSLPPLSKGGGLAARHKLLLCCVLLAICPPFLCYKLFCRQDGGIVTPSPLPKPHYPTETTNTLASLVKGEVLSPEKNSGDYRRDCHSTTPSQNLTIPRLTLNLPPLSKVRCCRPKKFGSLPEGLPPVAPNLSALTTIAKGQQPLAPY